MATFRLKAKTAPGLCSAMRCKEPVAERGLCARHVSDWQEAGEPALIVPEGAAPKAPKKGAALARVAPAELVAEIEPTRANLEQLLAKVAELPLDNQHNADWLGEARKFARAASEWLDGRRKAVKAPALDECRAVDAAFKPALEQAEAVVKCVDHRLKTLEIERRKGQDEALAAIAAGSSEPMTLAAAHGAGPTLPASVATRSTLRVKVLDLNAVPRPLLQLNEALALEYAKERGGASCKVAGLEFYLEESLVQARAAS